MHWSLIVLVWKTFIRALQLTSHTACTCKLFLNLHYVELFAWIMQQNLWLFGAWCLSWLTRNVLWDSHLIWHHFFKHLFELQSRIQLKIWQVHVPDKQAQNFSDDDTIRILLHSHILLKCINYAYAYSVVFLKQQFHVPTMSLEIFWQIDNECIEDLTKYGTPIPLQMSGERWPKMTTIVSYSSKRVAFSTTLRPIVFIISLAWTLTELIF